MVAATAATTLYCVQKVQQQLDNRKISLMGVLGALVFAAQMINFAIPATGSSGHMGGGLLLAILLGPHAAFLTLSSVLTVQALFLLTAAFWPLAATFSTSVFAHVLLPTLSFIKKLSETNLIPDGWL